jgi:hypothetical protein
VCPAHRAQPPAHSRTAARRQPRTRPVHDARLPGQSRRPLSAPWRPARSAPRGRRDATMPAFAVRTRPAAQARSGRHGFRRLIVPPHPHHVHGRRCRLYPIALKPSRPIAPCRARPQHAENPLCAVTAARGTCSRSTPNGGSRTLAWPRGCRCLRQKAAWPSCGRGHLLGRLGRRPGSGEPSAGSTSFPVHSGS